MPGRKGTADKAGTFPEETLFLAFSGSGGPRPSEALESFLAAGSIPLDVVLERLPDMPEGAWPLVLGGTSFLSVMVRFTPDSGILFLRPSTREDLCGFLDECYSGDRMLIADLSGNVLASSTCFEEGMQANTMADVLSPPSRLALLSALEEGSSGERIESFAASGAGDGRQYVLEPAVLRCPGTPVLIRFSNPSMGIEGADRESDASFERVFRGIPVPVVVLDSRGVIAGANEAARILWRDTLGREAESSLFFESLSDEDRPRVTALHQKIASSGSTTPVSLRAGLCSTDGRIIPAEMTAARFTETGDAVAAVVPSAFPDAADAGIGQTVSALLAALETRPSDEDLFRWVLELVRAGTGARGASCRLEGRTITVGDIQLEEDEGIDGGEEGESGQDEDSRSFTVPVKHRQGLLSLRLSGLSPDELAPGQDLVIRLASLFVDYAYGMESVDRITKTFSSIRDFWSLVSQQNGGLEGILKRMADVSSSDAVLVSGLREGESGLVPVAGFGYAGDLPVLSLEADTVATWAYTHGELTYMADSVRDSRFEAVCPGAGSEMAVPLLREGRTVGTLTASSRHRGGYSKPLPLVLSMMGTVISLWLYGGAGGADHRGSAGRRGGSMDRARTDSLLMALAQRLRSPMAAMAANAELMASGGVGELSGEQMECVESMTRSLDDLHDQCERLLTFIRLELHEATGEPIWADPAGLVATILPGLEKRAGTRKVSLKIDMPAEPFLACFDPSCMEQIVANLVDNAISFNMPGGEVLLRISLEGDIWTLEVSDTGRGIPPEELPGIFDGFRPGSGMPGHGTGLGIGLAIVKRFTELLGGIVSVWSSEKTGSRFVLRFPLSG